jgi:hypothetical protein
MRVGQCCVCRMMLDGLVHVLGLRVIVTSHGSAVLDQGHDGRSAGISMPCSTPTAGQRMHCSVEIS